eukprot:12408090-Alexandrium_andersonii.AAC.1
MHMLGTNTHPSLASKRHAPDPVCPRPVLLPRSNSLDSHPCLQPNDARPVSRQLHARVRIETPHP